MDSRSPGRIIGYAAWAFVAISAIAQEAPLPRMSLEEATSRLAPNFTPVHDSKRVIVEGAVSSKAVHLQLYSHIGIQNAAGHGIVVEADRRALAPLESGDVLEVQGAIHHRAGLPVIVAEKIRKVRVESAPAAHRTRAADLNSSRYLGSLVSVEGIVVGTGDNSGGDLLTIQGAGNATVNVFLPRDSRAGDGLAEFRQGDRVRATGLSSQYCPIPPHDRGYQILIGNPAAVTVLERGWFISPHLVLYGSIALLWTLGIWWIRERKMADHRKRMRAVTALAEDVICASTPGEIVRKLNSSLPPIFDTSAVELYLFNRLSNSLDRVPSETSPEPQTVNINTPLGPIPAAAALCFRNRALLHIPDMRRSPIIASIDATAARAALFVPLFAQREIVGVLSVLCREARRANREEDLAMQHLGNQVAAALKLQDQHVMREQLLRSEKMAAAGQLISGVATEVLAPLGEVSRIADQLLTGRPEGFPEEQMREIAFQAHRGSEIVRRLLSFARIDQTESRPLDLHMLAGNIMEFREHEWKQKRVTARNAMPVAPVFVFGDQSQLEQVVLNLLVHAEQCLAGSPEKTIAVTTRTISKNVQLWIDYSDRSIGTSSVDPFASAGTGDAFGLQVCQALAQSHGGEIRLLRNLPSGCRFEFELPLHQVSGTTSDQTDSTTPRLSRSLTAIIVEPETLTQRKLLALLGDRGHRAIPAATAEEAAEMAQRVRFDAVFCAVRLAGVSWVELFERVRGNIGAFVLLAEGYDSDLLRTFRGSEGHILSKPIDEASLDTVLTKVEARGAHSTSAS